MTATLITLLQLLGSLTSVLPGGAATGMVSQIIAVLSGAIPVIAADAPLAISAVKALIASVSASGAPTDAELATLAALDAQCDQVFDDAAAAFNAANPAAKV